MLIVRPAIESVKDPVHQFYLKFFYLTAARANEGCGVGAENEDTRPVGPTKEDVSYDSFEGVEVLKIVIHVLKRRKLTLRTVALPLNEYEPWARDISKEVAKLGVNDPIIPINRQTLNGILEAYGMYGLALSLEENVELDRLSNPLRHLRIHDLFEFYKLNGLEVSSYTGHSLSRTEKISSALDRYAHLGWVSYFPKLLKPLHPVSMVFV